MQNWQTRITDKTKITKLDVRTEISPARLDSWFDGFTNLTDISTLDKIDVSNCTTLSATFRNCRSITSLDPLKDWNTSNVTALTTVFDNCSSLSDLLPLSNWQVSSVTTAHWMFQNCKQIQSLEPLSNWDFSSLGGIEMAFNGCSGITSVETIYNWDLSNCNDISSLFSGMSSVTSIDFTRLQIDKSKLLYVMSMVDNSASLEYLDVSGFISPDIPAKNIVTMFYNCPELKVIKGLDTWDTSNIENFSSVFNSSSSLRSVDISSWSFDNATNVQAIFAGCSGLEVIKFNDSFVNALNRLSTQNAYLPFPLHDAEGNVYNSVSDLKGGMTYFTNVEHTHYYIGEGTVVPPTCTEQGYTAKVCEGCGETVK
ncbi:MAG: DUF285 domain-containing protein, partial [Clostridia bacterium]|nr:DUF285 domain-containing protein [Clostridia bacterium]